MDQDPLVAEQLDAGAKFVGEFNNYAPVGAAFWLKDSDSGQWYLCIASDRFDGERIPDAYGEVLRLNKELADPNFDPFQVKLISLDHPLAKAAWELYRGRPWKSPTRFHGRNFGGVSAPMSASLIFVFRAEGQRAGDQQVYRQVTEFRDVSLQAFHTIRLSRMDS